MTGNVEALLPGVTVLFDTDEVWASQPLRGRRGVVTGRYDASLGDGLDVIVCVGPCDRATHDTADCGASGSTVAFRPDELLLVPAEATS